MDNCPFANRANQPPPAYPFFLPIHNVKEHKLQGQTAPEIPQLKPATNLSITTASRREATF